MLFSLVMIQVIMTHCMYVNSCSYKCPSYTWYSGCIVKSYQKLLIWLKAQPTSLIPEGLPLRKLAGSASKSCYGNPPVWVMESDPCLSCYISVSEFLLSLYHASVVPWNFLSYWHLHHCLCTVLCIRSIWQIHTQSSTLSQDILRTSEDMIFLYALGRLEISLKRNLKTS